jgi:hypothetical protein
MSTAIERVAEDVRRRFQMAACEDGHDGTTVDLLEEREVEGPDERGELHARRLGR